MRNVLTCTFAYLSGRCDVCKYAVSESLLLLDHAQCPNIYHLRTCSRILLSLRNLHNLCAWAHNPRWPISTFTAFSPFRLRVYICVIITIFGLSVQLPIFRNAAFPRWLRGNFRSLWLLGLHGTPLSFYLVARYPLQTCTQNNAIRTLPKTTNSYLLQLYRGINQKLAQVRKNICTTNWPSSIFFVTITGWLLFFKLLQFFLSFSD